LLHASIDTMVLHTAGYPPSSKSIVIATRQSRLALWQAHHVQESLRIAHSKLVVELFGMTTEGDRKLESSLSKIGGKGLFVKELEAALEDGRAHLAVHSLKDVPAELPEGFALACVMQREDPRDAFVSNKYSSLHDLPDGAVVGTSSLRREVQIKARYPHVRVEPLRGNLDTRLRKLDEGQFDAIILAHAGLKRLGLVERVKAVIEPSHMLPAAAQGALGIEICSDRNDVQELLMPLQHNDTLLAVTAERAVLKALGGSCTMPIAAYCIRDQNEWWLRSTYGRPDGSLLHAEARIQSTTLIAMHRLGQQVADNLIEQGL
jgi:hydroxymethylbilane synthase